jgi:quinolinate synthase
MRDAQTRGVPLAPLQRSKEHPLDLPYTEEVAAATDRLYRLVERFITPDEWPHVAALVHAINALKAQRNAVILAHNYMTPDIFHLVGDFRGDSLGLAREAALTDAEVIVQAGVHFMAETAKILAPAKTVLIPDVRAGCSLAASITGADVQAIRNQYPGVPVVTYVNTTADVKAECDITCTSSNAVQVCEAVAERFGTDRVILIPDQYLARNVAAQTELKIITWAGSCEVHDRFDASDIEEIRAAHPDAIIVAHPECPPEVVKASDFAGSTGAMIDFVKSSGSAKVVLVTECSMADNIAAEVPQTEFMRPCNLCPHMKRITLENVYLALRDMKHVVEVPEAVRRRAHAAIQAMLDLPAASAPAQFDTDAPLTPVEFVTV